MRGQNDVGRFRFATGDVNWLEYGGTWCWQVPGTQRFHFIRLMNWEDTVGSREAEDLPTYNVDCSEVDLESVSPEQVKSAVESCGRELDGPEPHWVPGAPATEHMLVRALALAEYGARAPIWDESGNNWRRLFRAAAQASLEVAGDARKLDQGTCNQLGSTPREMMRGDFTSAVARGVAGGDPAAALMARIYKTCDYQTLGGRLPQNQVDAIEDALEGK